MNTVKNKMDLYPAMHKGWGWAGMAGWECKGVGGNGLVVVHRGGREWLGGGAKGWAGIKNGAFNSNNVI